MPIKLTSGNQGLFIKKYIVHDKISGASLDSAKPHLIQIHFLR